MKLKTLMSAALAIVGSAAVAAVSQPAAWFSEAVESTLSTGTWSGDEGAYTYVAAVDETPAYVEIDTTNSVTFAPSSASASTGKVRETIKFAVASVDSLDETILESTDIQTSFCVYDGSYYAAVKTNDVPAWVNIGTAAEEDAWVTIAMEFDYTANTVAFYTVANETETQLSATIDEEVVTAFAPLNVKTCVTSTGFMGCGQVASLAGVQQGFYGVGDNYYLTFAEAKTAAAGTETITLYTDVAGELSVGDTVKIMKNGHTFTPIIADGVALSETQMEDVFTYEARAGLAKLNDKWYITFEEAYAQASADTDTMLIKIDKDFSRSFDNSHSFESVTFTNTSSSAENITISTLPQYGDATFTAKKWIFPKNATLTLGGECKVEDAEGGVIEISEGAKIEINGTSTFKDIEGIIGAGELIAPATPTYFIGGSKVITEKMLTNELWTGTFELRGNYGTGDIELANIANAGSTVRFNGFTAGTIGTDYTTYPCDVVLTNGGLTVGGTFTRNNMTISGDFSGSGALTIADAQDRALYLNLTGDASGFTGDILATNANVRISFGGTTTAGGGSITVAAGACVTNAIDATWTAKDVVVKGELVANGTMAVSGQLWGSEGTGVYTANSKDAALKVAGTWNGTYNANFKFDSATTEFDIPVNANATTVINGADGEFYGFPKTISNSKSAAPTVNGSIVLNANWTVGNGWTDQTTTFASLSGAGNLTVNGNGNGNTIPYVITTLDGYTGTLGGVRGGYTIGKVNVVELPADGTRVVKTAIGTSGSINDNVPLYVNNVDTGKTLTYNAEGADGAGLYLVGGSTPGVEPGASDGKTYDTAEAATNAAQSVTVAVPAAVTNVLTDAAAQTTYKGMFEGKVVDNGDGTYGVMVDLKVSATSDIQADVDAAETTVGGQLSTIAASTTATEVGIADAAPGIYYGVGVADTVDGTYTVTTWTMAGASGAANLSVPAANGAAKKFYKVMATAKVTE